MSYNNRVLRLQAKGRSGPQGKGIPVSRTHGSYNLHKNPPRTATEYVRRELQESLEGDAAAENRRRVAQLNVGGPTRTHEDWQRIYEKARLERYGR